MKKFTVRDLFWLVLVAAMGLGWLANGISLHRQIEALRQELLPHRERERKEAMQELERLWRDGRAEPFPN